VGELLIYKLVIRMVSTPKSEKEKFI